MKKIFILILLLISFGAYAQTSFIVYPMSSIGADSIIRPNAGAQHWGTTDFGNPFNTAPSIPPGNNKPLNFYTRFNWQDIESSSTQGSYTWTTFDAFVDQAMDSGAMFSFGVMIFCNGCGSLGNLPTYVVNAMNTEGKPSWSNSGFTMPNYQSLTLITNYWKLMHAILNHINTTSRSGVLFSKAFLGYDLRHYGNFGEGNGFPTGTNTASQCPSGAQVTDTYLISMTDSAISVFSNVQLTIPMSYIAPDNDYNNSDGNTGTHAAYHVLTSTNSYGRIGWRRDNIGDDGYNAYITGTTATYNPGTGSVPLLPLIMNMWQFGPIGGEPANDLCGTSRAGYPQWDKHNEDTLFHMNHFGNGNYPILITDQSSYTCSGQLPPFSSSITFTHGGDSIRTNVVRSSALEGPRIIIDSGSVSNLVSGAPFILKTSWRNKGLGPIYENWNIVFELRQTNGITVVATDTSVFSLKLFLPRTTDSTWLDIFNLPSGITAGTYKLYMIIRDPVAYKKPYPIANYGRNSDGSYLVIPSVTVAAAGANYDIGTGGTINITSQGSYNIGDTLNIVSGTYGASALSNLKGLYIRLKNNTASVTFTGTLSMITDSGVTLTGSATDSMYFTNASGSCISNNTGTVGHGWTDVNIFYCSFYNTPHACIDQSGNISYVQSSSPLSYHWLRVRIAHCHEIRCNKLVQGAFGHTGDNSGVPTDVDRQVDIDSCAFENTSATGGASFKGLEYGGICFHCLFHDLISVDTTTEGPEGDIGVIFNNGWNKIYNVYKNGGPGYIFRSDGVEQEDIDPGRDTIYNCLKVNSTGYGAIGIQFDSTQSNAGKWHGTGADIWNITSGNGVECCGYWDPVVNNGNCPTYEHYYAHNVIGFNTPAATVSGKNPTYNNLGGSPGWGSIAGDTSNSHYFLSATAAGLDSTTNFYAGTTGNYKLYGLTPSTNSQILNGGITSTVATKDLLGNPYRTPPDLGALQLNVTTTCNCHIRYKGAQTKIE